jgi:2-polyprenyl-6-methoxyphenol hydroxylase-like FAD-dependent oxidoreductase
MEIAVIGAGPVGLMLAAELRLGGAEVVVLDRRAAPAERPRANGLVGRIVEQLDHRGLLERFRAEAAFAGPFPGFPFGAVPLNFAKFGQSPLRGLMVQQPRMEAVLTERATELGAEIRRGHELVRLDPFTVRGPDGEYRAEPEYVVGCDGAHSRVRELAGIGFPGTTEGELLRLGHFRADAPLFAETTRGWDRRSGGRVLVTSLTPGVVIVGVREVTPEPPGEPTLDEFRAATGCRSAW